MRLLIEATFGIAAGCFIAAVALGALDRSVAIGLGVVAMAALVITSIRDCRTARHG